MIIPIFYYNCLIILIIVSLQLSIAARKNAAAQPSKPSPIEGRIMDIANRILAILIAIAWILVIRIPVHSSKNFISFWRRANVYWLLLICCVLIILLLVWRFDIKWAPSGVKQANFEYKKITWTDDALLWIVYIFWVQFTHKLVLCEWHLRVYVACLTLQR